MNRQPCGLTGAGVEGGLNVYYKKIAKGYTKLFLFSSYPER